MEWEGGGWWEQARFEGREERGTRTGRAGGGYGEIGGGQGARGIPFRACCARKRETGEGPKEAVRL